ncbi:MAG: helix-turn-helix domain-containing protein [Cyclobacteriaceae bacterium]|nr:helix-turn-helix domain-containing protein [Cyclobacteriaceae bacterium]
MGSQLFKNVIKNIPKDSMIFAEKSLDIIDQIQYLIEREGKTQKEIALELGKNESEISKWLSGLHNMTMKTVSKLEAVLGSDILITPLKAQKKYSEVKFIPVKVARFRSMASIEVDTMESVFHTVSNLKVKI